MAQLGFLGLGIMGYPMAKHLLAAGHDVALWSHTASKAKELAKEGKGAVSLDGRLIDIASIRMAEALLKKAESIRASGGA